MLKYNRSAHYSQTVRETERSMLPQGQHRGAHPRLHPGEHSLSAGLSKRQKCELVWAFFFLAPEKEIKPRPLIVTGQ